MTKRKLDTKRLYFVSTIVVLLFFLAFFSLGLRHWVLYVSMKPIYNEAVRECDRRLEIRNSELVAKGYNPIEIEDDLYNSLICDVKPIGKYMFEKKQTIILLAISFSLPILFFGGTWIFNYLFPKLADRKS